jgi:hypothetical protein
VARCPFALWRPLPENSTEPRIKPTQFILHSAVDAPGATDLRRYFARADVTVESHFWVRLDGTLEQFLDTERQADANRTANVRAVSVETEDDGKPDTTPWTPAQVATLVRLGVWLHKTHGIPPRVCPHHDAPGVGYHTLFGAPGPWTPSRGKTCPGRVRIGQVPGIVAAIAAACGAPAPAATARPAPAGPRVLGRGDRGDDVRAFQVLLNVKGLARLQADGDFGPATEAAVKAAQRAVGVDPDGLVGPATRRAVDAYRKPAEPLLKKGARGAAVSRLQALMRDQHRHRITVDGIFGADTERQVKAFQKARGLTPDGIVGPKTWDLLT